MRADLSTTLNQAGCIAALVLAAGAFYAAAALAGEFVLWLLGG